MLKAAGALCGTEIELQVQVLVLSLMSGDVGHVKMYLRFLIIVLDTVIPVLSGSLWGLKVIYVYVVPGT